MFQAPMYKNVEFGIFLPQARSWIRFYLLLKFAQFLRKGERLKLLCTNMWNLVFFARSKITDTSLFVIFSPGDILEPVILDRERSQD